MKIREKIGNYIQKFDADVAARRERLTGLGLVETVMCDGTIEYMHTPPHGTPRVESADEVFESVQFYDAQTERWLDEDYSRQDNA